MSFYGDKSKAILINNEDVLDDLKQEEKVEIDGLIRQFFELPESSSPIEY